MRLFGAVAFRTRTAPPVQRMKPHRKDMVDMSVRFRVFAVAAVFAVSMLSAVPPVLAADAAAEPKKIFDIDFTQNHRQRDIDRKGSFHGVLPKEVIENFSGWLSTKTTTEYVNNGDEGYLRFSTFGARSQFYVTGDVPEIAGRYKVVIEGRVSVSSGPLRFALRNAGAPYTNFAIGEFSDRSFTRRVYYFDLKPPEDASSGSRYVARFFFYPPPEMDLKRISLYRADGEEREPTAQVLRPAKDVKQFFRHTEFPFGLPVGWSVGRGDGDPHEVFSEPFQTNEPDVMNHVRIEGTGAEDCKVSIFKDSWYIIANGKLNSTVKFKPAPESSSYTVRISSKSPFTLTRALAWGSGAEPPAVRDSARVFLAASGEIADQTKAVFTDEPMKVRWMVKDAPADASLSVKVVDVYGRTRNAGTVSLAAGDASGVMDVDVFKDMPLGSFRIEASVVRGSSAVSQVEEIVLARLHRPKYWGRDAQNSHFGAHFYDIDQACLLMKAAGINWTRFHDCNTDVSGWYALESEKGRWEFENSDRRIANYRRHHVKIFAQLGTSPKWASNYDRLGFKRFGYFERYLRPKSNIDFLNYVRTFVSRNRGKIDSYFLWNEPWGGWWSSNKDIGIFGKENAGRDFGVLQTAVGGLLKKEFPDVEFCGYNGYVGNAKWIDDVDSVAGAWNVSDNIDFHRYCDTALALNADEPVADCGAFDGLRRRHGDFAKRKVFMTEGQGTSPGSGAVPHQYGGMYLHTLTWKPESKEDVIYRADATARYSVSLIAGGVDRIFLYAPSSYRALGIKTVYSSLVCTDGTAHPMLVAHAFAALMLEDKKFVAKRPYGGYGVEFEFAGGGETVVAYSGLTKDEALGLRAYDIFGNRITAETFLPGTLAWVIKKRGFAADSRTARP